MVYSSRFVLTALVNGQVQKELADGTVPIPFGSEYSIRFRNKNNRRAVVKFTIDGENVSGNGYVIEPNSYTDIHRHWDKDAKFKFVALDSPDAVDFGKNGPNTDRKKGVVEARFYLEKERPMPPAKVEHHHHYYPYQPWSEIKNWPITPVWGTAPEIYPNLCNPYVSPTTTNMTLHNLGADGGYGTTDGCCSSAMPANIPSKITIDASSLPSVINCCSPGQGFSPVFPAATPPVLQEGCTVEGNTSGQTFISTSIEYETDFTTLRLILKGFTSENAPCYNEYCSKCGAKKARANDNFCGVCGNNLRPMP